MRPHRVEWLAERQAAHRVNFKRDWLRLYVWGLALGVMGGYLLHLATFDTAVVVQLFVLITLVKTS